MKLTKIQIETTYGIDNINLILQLNRLQFDRYRVGNDGSREPSPFYLILCNEGSAITYHPHNRCTKGDQPIQVGVLILLDTNDF